MKSFSEKERTTAQKVAKELADRLGYRTSVKEVVKSGEKLLGVRVETGSGIEPVVYLDFDLSVEEQVEEMERAFKEALENPPFSMGETGEDIMSRIYTWDYVKEHVVMRVLPRKGNLTFLKKGPYRRFLDLAVVYYVQVGTGAAYRVENDLAESLGVTAKELDKLALENTPEIFPSDMPKLANMFASVGLEVPMMEKPIMQPCTNVQGLFGASTLRYPGLIGEYAEKIGDDLIIIPSSVHEVLLLPAATVDVEQIGNMIKEVNECEADPKEVLSDHPYMYSREKKRVVAA